MKAVNFLIIFLVLFLILTPFVLEVYFVIIPWLGSTPAGIILVWIETACVIMILINYYKGIVTSPGTPPKGWKPDVETTHDTSDGDWGQTVRYCNKCLNYKPPRTHHCRRCDKCVLKMDHHCPWLTNCIGAENQRYFVTFLFYVTFSISLSFFVLLCRITTLFAKGLDFRDTPLYIVIAMITSLTLPVLLGVGSLFIWQSWLVLHNITTVEYTEWIRLRRLHGRKKLWFPWDLGSKKANFHAVFGKRLIGWLLPIPLVAEEDFKPSDGLYYPIADKSLMSSLVLPPSLPNDAADHPPLTHSANSSLKNLFSARRTHSDDDHRS